MLKGDVLWKPAVHVVQIKQHIKDNYMYTSAFGHLGFFGSPLSLNCVSTSLYAVLFDFTDHDTKDNVW